MVKRLVFFLSCLFLISSMHSFVSAQDNAESGEELASRPRVILQTTQGDVQIELWPDIAPKACENFLGLVNKGYYDGVIFHRVIKGFMVQGGDPSGTGRGGQSIWGKPFEDEVSTDVQFDRQGLLAMANAGPNTNGSQFFITTVPTPHLNMRHTIFGEVVSGYEIIQAIENTQTGPGDKPLEDQKITNAQTY